MIKANSVSRYEKKLGFVGFSDGGLHSLIFRKGSDLC